MKRLLVVLLAAVMLMLAHCPLVEAQTRVEQGDFVFEQSYSGRLILEEYKGYSAYVTVPQTVLGATVEVIGTNAFQYEYSLKEVTIPYGVEDIEYWAFYSCRNLEKVYVPASVTMIASNAFQNCPKMILYGSAGSYVERFADLYGYPFVSSNEEPIPLSSYPLYFADADATIDTSGTYPAIDIPLVNISDSFTLSRYLLAFKLRDAEGNMIRHNTTGSLALFHAANATIPPLGDIRTGFIVLEGYDNVKFIEAAIGEVYFPDGSSIYIPAEDLEFFYWEVDDPITSLTPTPDPTTEPTTEPTATLTTAPTATPTTEPTATPTTEPTTEPTGEPITEPSTEPSTGLPGDANNDGNVGIDDLTEMIDAIVNKRPPKSLENADLDGNKETDLADLLSVIALVLTN